MNRLILVLIAASLIGACKKDQFISDSHLFTTLSADSIRFDTVFTSAGSITQALKIFNYNDQNILINSIRLAGGYGSPFKININGEAGIEKQHVQIPAGDSIYVFIQVSIDPTNAANPFIVADSIEVNCNGNIQWVQLEAYGQNAHFLKNHSITTDENWVNDLPYVITGELKITETASLTIHKGVRIYAHSNAAILVHGSLTVLGESADSNKVVFTNDRLDVPYSYLPGSWQGIIFEASSSGNQIFWAVVKNAVKAISLKNSSGNDFQLSIKNSIIDNSSEQAIYSNGSSFYAENCLLSNNGKGIHIDNGGNYHLIHCTLAAYTNELIHHDDPLVYISDSFEPGGQPGSFETTALFENCIIWGDEGFQGNEVIIGRNGNSNFVTRFTNSIIRTDGLDTSIHYDNCHLNIDPVFINTDRTYGAYNFHLTDLSVAIDNGIQTAVTKDLDNLNRSVPDPGCYEYVP